MKDYANKTDYAFYSRIDNDFNPFVGGFIISAIGALIGTVIIFTI